jgi:hypothetical protein
MELVGVGSLSQHSFVGVAVHVASSEASSRRAAISSSHDGLALYCKSEQKLQAHFWVYARIRASNTFRRASSLVLSMRPCRLKSDKHKSKNAGLAQENRFATADVLSLLRLLKGAANESTF